MLNLLAFECIFFMGKLSIYSHITTKQIKSMSDLYFVRKKPAVREGAYMGEKDEPESIHIQVGTRS